MAQRLVRGSQTAQRRPRSRPIRRPAQSLISGRNSAGRPARCPGSLAVNAMPRSPPPNSHVLSRRVGSLYRTFYSSLFNHRYVLPKMGPTRELRGDKQKDPPVGDQPRSWGGVAVRPTVSVRPHGGTPMRTPRYEDRADNDFDADRQPDPRQMFSMLNKSLALCDLHQQERAEVEVDPVWSARRPRHHATAEAKPGAAMR